MTGDAAAPDPRETMKRPVVLRLDGMEAIPIRRFELNPGQQVHVHLPPPSRRTEPPPVVHFAFGLTDAQLQPRYGVPLCEIQQYRDWARLIAASGMAAVTYQVKDAEADLAGTIEQVRRRADELEIAASRIALWACSMNCQVALRYAVSRGGAALRCAVLYYGIIPPVEVRTDLPIQLVRAGRDAVAEVNPSIDRFLAEAERTGAPVDFIDYRSGVHAFDVADDSEPARDIVRRTLAFLREHLRTHQTSGPPRPAGR